MQILGVWVKREQALALPSEFLRPNGEEHLPRNGVQSVMVSPHSCFGAVGWGSLTLSAVVSKFRVLPLLMREKEPFPSGDQQVQQQNHTLVCVLLLRLPSETAMRSLLSLGPSGCRSHSYHVWLSIQNPHIPGGPSKPLVLLKYLAKISHILTF